MARRSVMMIEDLHAIISPQYFVGPINSLAAKKGHRKFGWKCPTEVNCRPLCFVIYRAKADKIKSLRNRYHNLILIAKKKFYSNHVSSSSTNPRRLLQTVNKLLHRKATSPLPTSSSSMSLPDRFASFFTNKIPKLRRLTLSSQPANVAMTSPHCPSPLASPPDFSTFRPASQAEVCFKDPSQLSQQAMWLWSYPNLAP